MKRTLLALALATVATSASADSWLYAGVNYGTANYTAKGVDSDKGMGIHVGTGILPFIGVEAGYWGLGSSADADYSTWYAAIKPSMSLGDIEVYGKLGLNRYDVQGGATRSSTDGYDFMYGVGAEYTILDNIPLGSLSAGAAYTRFGFGNFETDTYSLSLTLHFL